MKNIFGYLCCSSSGLLCAGKSHEIPSSIWWDDCEYDTLWVAVVFSLPERLYERSCCWQILHKVHLPSLALLLCPSPPAEFSRESLLEAQGGLDCPLSKEKEECSNAAAGAADPSSSSPSSSSSQQQRHTNAGTPESKALFARTRRPHGSRRHPFARQRLFRRGKSFCTLGRLHGTLVNICSVALIPASRSRNLRGGSSVWKGREWICEEGEGRSKYCGFCVFMRFCIWIHLKQAVMQSFDCQLPKFFRQTRIHVY